MRIAISSKSGCGNTTVSTLLAKTLDCKLINFTFRQLSQEKNIEFWTLIEMAKTNFDLDRELDSRQVEMAMSEENCVLGSRLAIWMLKDADLKVYLTASDITRAERVFKREGGSLEERFNETVKRDQTDSMRYMEIYQIDNTKPEEVADLIIDTDDKNPEEIVALILKELESRNLYCKK